MSNRIGIYTDTATRWLKYLDVGFVVYVGIVGLNKPTNRQYRQFTHICFSYDTF